MSNSIPSYFRAYLSSSLVAGGSETTISLDRITTITGETLETSDWGDFSRGIATINPDGDGVTTYPEMVSFTGINASGFTGVTRGLNKSGTATTSLKRFHPSGTPVIISFTGLGIKDLVTYLNSLVVSTRNIIVVGTAGETVAAGNLIYFDTTDDEWKLCDADTATTVENVMLGIAQGAGVNGGLITNGVLLRGMDSNQSGMTVGDIMYAGNTAGGISSSAGTKEVSVGIAKSATELYFSVRFNQMITEDEQDALVGNLETPSVSNKYVTQKGFQKGAEIYSADAGASDAYAITLSPVPASYYTGMVVHFKANTANTGASTLNVNSLGAIAIKKRRDQDTVTGDIESGQIVTVVYDGTNFQMQSQMATNDASIPIGKNIASGSLTISQAVSTDSDTVTLGFRPRLIIANVRIATSGASVESVAIGQFQYVDGIGYVGIQFGGASANNTNIDDLEYQHSSIISNNGMTIDTAGANLIDGYISISNITSTGFDINFTRTGTAGTASATATYQLAAIE